jgi:beta-mannosidase
MTIDLCGQWEIRKQGDTETLLASVPGCIHTDLLAAGKIDDPYYRDNEDRQMWIGETDWVYSRTFTVDQDFLDCDRVLLRCEGLDTLGTITINDTLIGKTDNQFRRWEFDVKPHLQAGENRIEICFDSTIPFIQAEQQKRYLNLTGVGQHRIDGSNRIRKSQCNYGWDWGPMCVTAGIWRPIGLLAFNSARITDVHIIQDHSQKNVVSLRVVLNIEKTETAAALTAKFRVFYEDSIVCQTEVACQDNAVETTVNVENPKLWWPNDLGEQPLYDVHVELIKEDVSIDTVSKKIGLRTLVLDRHADQWGESFQFVVNDKPFFAKGANWIPVDTFVTRITKEHYEHLIKSAADAHMNMLRVWGGGIYEDDVFYDLCDQYGICIWQDFMFACSAYPAFDEAFMKNVHHEAEDQVKRLRHHPSLALWCGNNELEQIAHMFIGDVEEDKRILEKYNSMLAELPPIARERMAHMLTGYIVDGKMTWEEYHKLFDELLPGVVKTYDPERIYWPSSPHSPLGDRLDHNNPTCGDAHFWDIWHGRQPFEWYRTSQHRFVSEFGFQAFPEPMVVNSYTAEEDWNVTSYIMEKHQRSQIGNDVIIQYMLSWFKLPTSFEMTLWLSQILQGIGIKYAVEHWRRSMPRGMGTLYWQINDCWPVTSWSSIDYFGNWKALHYMARDFYAPLLISAIEDTEQVTVEVHVTSDLLQATSGMITWTLTDTSGKTLANNEIVCNIVPSANRKVMTLQFADHLAEYGKRQLLLWLELLVDGNVVSQNLVSFTRPKHLELQNPELTTQIREIERNTFEVTIEAQQPALWVWPEFPGIKAEYSKRFFHLCPGKPITVNIQVAKEMALVAFEEKLKVNSLVDIWQEK